MSSDVSVDIADKKNSREVSIIGDKISVDTSDNLTDSTIPSLVTESEVEKKTINSEVNAAYEESGDDEDESVDRADGPKYRRKKSSSLSIPIDEEEVETEPEKSNTRNTYAAKKTVAQGMMDIALITANANQLRYMVEFNQNSSTFILNVILIAISLLLQVAVGISLIFKGRMDLRGESKHRNAKRINNYVVVAVFLITIINVFMASFTIIDKPAVAIANNVQ